MLIWVVALHCEAKPVIDYYRLRKSHADNAFEIYQGDDMLCLVSGIGKVACAAACGWAAARQREDASLAWINLGCAGAARHEVGSAFSLDKIVDADTGQTYYPVPVSPGPLPAAACMSLSRASKEYREDFLFDMEASAFMQSALRFSSAELTKSIKVVSDNRGHQTGKDRAATSRLIEKHIEDIDREASSLLELNREVAARAITADDWRRLNELAHFSQTQQNRLRVLWRYLCNRNHSADALLQQLARESSARAMIESLEALSYRDSEEL